MKEELETRKKRLVVPVLSFLDVLFAKDCKDNLIDLALTLFLTLSLLSRNVTLSIFLNNL